MRKKIYNVLNKIYGITMTVAFFAGFLPLIPFIVAICIGGQTGEAISVFLYKQYYPWVIVLASIAVIIGLVAMYIAKIDALSVKSVGTKAEDGDNAGADNAEATEDTKEEANPEK